MSAKLVPYLTTIDNPYDPRDEFEMWYAHDRTMGHNTLELLGRVVRIADDMSPADQDDSRDAAIEEIIMENVSGVHKKVMLPDD